MAGLDQNRRQAPDPGQPDLLEVRDLDVGFSTPDGEVSAVRGVTLSVNAGETLGVVGESGSGKSVTALAVLGLIPCPPGRVSGDIRLGGQSLMALSREALRAIRGNRISMIFQEPMTSLNPVLTIGHQIAEVTRLHLGLGRRAALANAAEMLRKVGIPLPEQRIREYPHQLSGGMRQRAMIAMALACSPEVLLADEPTTALDVTIQAQIIDLMMALRDDYGTAIVFISHDMSLVADTCDRVVVMYAGRVVEAGPVADIFVHALHPYTQGLLQCIPRLRFDASEPRASRLVAIPGTVPSAGHLPRGCEFAPRCANALPVCGERVPPWREESAGHGARCWLYADER